MDAVTRNGVTVDQCSRCELLWFDRWEIKHYLDWAASGLQENKISDESFQLGSGALGDRCPHCSTNSFKNGAFRTVRFRICTDCGGLCLGREELLKLIEPSPKRIKGFLERQNSLIDFLFWGESLWFLGFMKLFYDELPPRKTT
jgi:Zn-finger nucleic acid-binding protein